MYVWLWNGVAQQLRELAAFPGDLEFDSQHSHGSL